MKTTLPQELLPEIAARIEQAHRKFQKIYPGTIADRQPVHTYYQAAHLFRSDIVACSRNEALAALDDFAPNFVSFAKVIGLAGSHSLEHSHNAVEVTSKAMSVGGEALRRQNWPAWLAYTVYQRVREKLLREPIEDLRIDFEDGYGNRPNEEEDRHAVLAANELAAALNAQEPWPSIGIRIKPFTKDLCQRSIRTLDIFLTELAAKAYRNIPEHILITLAKIYVRDEVAALAEVCSRIEPKLGFRAGTLRIELMAETTATIFNERGEVNLLSLVQAGDGRCVAVHFGTYDYTAARNLTAADQHMLHFACDFAREVMQIALAGTGIWLSDGGTNILPVTSHRGPDRDQSLSQQLIAEDRETVHRAWKLHFDHVRHSLQNGYYQGWDLHPVQLPTRYAAVISFFLENIGAAGQRLRTFVGNAAMAEAQVADDAATGQGMFNYFRRAIRCRAITPEEAQDLTNLTPQEFSSGSLAKILEERRT